MPSPLLSTTPMSAQRPEIHKVGNKKRRRSCCSYDGATLPSPKQQKLSTVTSPSAVEPSKNTYELKTKKPSSIDIELSLKKTIETHLNMSLEPWFTSLKDTQSTSPQCQPLQPSTTYIYMQLDPEDPTSYIYVPLPPSLLAQMTAPPSPHTSPSLSTTKGDKVESLYAQTKTKASSSLLTPPQTPPRMSTQAWSPMK